MKQVKKRVSEIDNEAYEKMRNHADKWNSMIDNFTKSSIEARQAIIFEKIEDLKSKKKKLEKLLDMRKSRSSKSLDIDARIRASARQNYFIVAEHYQRISRSIEKIEEEQREYMKLNRIKNFVKKNTEGIETKCKVFDTKVYDWVSDLVVKKETEKEMILKKREVQIRKNSFKE